MDAQEIQKFKLTLNLAEKNPFVKNPSPSLIGRQISNNNDAKELGEENLENQNPEVNFIFNKSMLYLKSNLKPKLCSQLNDAHNFKFKAIPVQCSKKEEVKNEKKGTFGYLNCFEEVSTSDSLLEIDPSIPENEINNLETLFQNASFKTINLSAKDCNFKEFSQYDNKYDLSITDNTQGLLDIKQFKGILIPSLNESQLYSPEQSFIMNTIHRKPY